MERKMLKHSLLSDSAMDDPEEDEELQVNGVPSTKMDSTGTALTLNSSAKTKDFNKSERINGSHPHKRSPSSSRTADKIPIVVEDYHHGEARRRRELAAARRKAESDKEESDGFDRMTMHPVPLPKLKALLQQQSESADADKKEKKLLGAVETSKPKQRREKEGEKEGSYSSASSSSHAIQSPHITRSSSSSRESSFLKEDEKSSSPTGHGSTLAPAEDTRGKESADRKSIAVASPHSRRSPDSSHSCTIGVGGEGGVVEVEPEGGAPMQTDRHLSVIDAVREENEKTSNTIGRPALRVTVPAGSEAVEVQRPRSSTPADETGSEEVPEVTAPAPALSESSRHRSSGPKKNVDDPKSRSVPKLDVLLPHDQEGSSVLRSPDSPTVELVSNTTVGSSYQKVGGELLIESMNTVAVKDSSLLSPLQEQGKKTLVPPPSLLSRTHSNVVEESKECRNSGEEVRGPKFPLPSTQAAPPVDDRPEIVTVDPPQQTEKKAGGSQPTPIANAFAAPGSMYNLHHTERRTLFEPPPAQSSSPSSPLTSNDRLLLTPTASALLLPAMGTTHSSTAADDSPPLHLQLSIPHSRAVEDSEDNLYHSSQKEPSQRVKGLKRVSARQTGSPQRPNTKLLSSPNQNLTLQKDMQASALLRSLSEESREPISAGTFHAPPTPAGLTDLEGIPPPPRPPTSQEFTLASYKELHQRRFCTRSEELTFLRHHFVTSRKRVLYLYDYCKTLKAALVDKNREAEYWKDQLVKLRKLAADEENRYISSGSTNVETSRLHRMLLSNTTSLSKAMEEEEVGMVSEIGSLALTDHKGKSSRSSALWLYAATRPMPGGGGGVAGKSKAGREGGSITWRRQHNSNGPGGKCTACEHLLKELRNNLARRDNEISSLRMENNDLSHARNTLEREMRVVKQDLRQRTDERNQLHQVLAEKEKTLDLVQEAGNAAKEEQHKLMEQVQKLKERNEVLELIGAGPSTRRLVLEEVNDGDSEEEEEDVVIREEIVYDRETGEKVLVRHHERGYPSSSTRFRRGRGQPKLRRAVVTRSRSRSEDDEEDDVAVVYHSRRRSPHSSPSRVIQRSTKRIVKHHFHSSPSGSSPPMEIRNIYHSAASPSSRATREEVLTASGNGSLASHIAEENLLAEVKHLQKQLQLYREKWLKAQDEAEELQRRWSRKAAQETSPHGTAVVPPPLPPPPATLTSLEHYTREMEMQKEEIHRLQRRLERQADTASFHEEQLRQEQMDQQRQHRAVVLQLQDQLQLARREINKAEEDRQRAIKQLRDYVEDGKLKEVLQQQKEALRQRMNELTNELSEVRGNEKELKLTVQKEMADKLHLSHEKSQLEATLLQKERQEHLLNDEIQVLQKRLGESEGRVFALQERLHLLQEYPGKESQGTHQNPEALASEMKGYASLMALNTQQQQRLSELESKLLSTTNELFRVQQQQSIRQHEAQMEQWIGGAASPSQLPAVEASPRLQQLRGSLLAEIAQLREELEQNRGRQRRLLEQWEGLHKEHQEVRRDNYLLASGTESLMRKLERWRRRRERDATQKAALASSPTAGNVSVVCQRERLRAGEGVNDGDGQAHVQVHVGDTPLEGKEIQLSITRQKLKEARDQDWVLQTGKNGCRAEDSPSPSVRHSLRKSEHIYAPQTSMELFRMSGGEPPSSRPRPAHSGRDEEILTSEEPTSTSRVGVAAATSRSDQQCPGTASNKAKEVRFQDPLGSHGSAHTGQSTTASTAQHAVELKALQKLLKTAKKEISEYELLVTALDSTGKLDELLQEAVTTAKQQRQKVNV